MTSIHEPFVLRNGVSIPRVGFGTWQIPDGPETYDSVRSALDAGYRHIDTALAYGNEQSVGRAVRDSGIDRDEIFITTKLPAQTKTAAGAREAFETSRTNLDLGVVDLYLIHAPWPWTAIGSDHRAGNIEVWKVFEELYAAESVRAIGVSNFDVDDLESLVAATDVVPFANQIRWFVGHTQGPTSAWCDEHGVLVEAYSPLATGGLLDDADLVAIADRAGRSPAQVALRYAIDRGVLPLPKSTTPSRIAENLDLRFELSDEDLATLDAVTSH